LPSALALFLLVSPAAPQTATIRTTTREVLLDFVVRDKKERGITDLRPADVQVYEDGVPQTIKTFHLISGAEQRQSESAAPAGGAAAATPATASNPLRETNLVSLVFQAMSPGGRRFAREAALQFLQNELTPNTYVAVFSLDYRLNALQNYTRDVDALRKAVERAASGNYDQFVNDSANVLRQVSMNVRRGPSGFVVEFGFDPFSSSGMATAGAEQVFTRSAQVMNGILHGEVALESYQFGMRSVMALLLLAREQARLPGRKTVLYFSEGLVVPPDHREPFRTAIAEANRANVSFYSIDAGGLSTVNPMLPGQNELRNAAKNSQDQQALIAAPASNETTAEISEKMKDWMHQDDSLLYALSANPQQGMQELAESTGGFLIADTNDIVKPLHRIMEDVGTHYELTYTPASQVYDGRFRRIEVKLPRKGLRVQARDGYYALPDLNGEPLLPFEMVALKALDASPLPQALGYHAAALPFRPVPGGAEYDMVFDLPMSQLTVHLDREHPFARLHASFLALLKDDRGQVIGKISRDLPRIVPADKLEGFRQGDMVFAQPFAVRAGRYTLETAVLDREGGGAAARRSVFVVPKPARGPALSAIVLVRRVDRLDVPWNPIDPLEPAGHRITPALTGQAPAGSTPSLYFAVYPDAAEGAPKPEVTVRYFAFGREVARQAPALPPPDSTGAIPVMLQADLHDPGHYQVRVTVRQGASEVHGAAEFWLN
jgi:VWFA-related protein